MSYSKSIFISYCDNDKDTAVELHSFLVTLFGDEIWVKDFDLNGGDLIVDSIALAVTDANCFIIIISNASIKSNWVKTQLNLATIRSIEDDNFKIIVIRIDKSEWPNHLRVALDGKFTVDLSEVQDRDNEYFKVANFIDASALIPKNEIYLGRGDDTDRFSLLARRNKIIFILGWAGIGKTKFVTNSVSEKTRKRPLSLRMTKAQSIDLLARQIIQKAHVRQPISLETFSDKDWIDMALDALKQRQDHFFLFLDNAEESLTPDNKLLPYLEHFLESFSRTDIETYIILATTRTPDYPASIGSTTDVLKLFGLGDIYIKEIIDLGLEEVGSQLLLSSPELSEIVGLVGGHPLAAKMMTSYLKIRPPASILSEKSKRRFQLKIAEYILRSATQSILSELHLLILYILAIVREPVTLHDILSIKKISRYDLETIHKAILKLTELFLIEQNGEMMSLHNFIEAYYREQLSNKKAILENLCSQFGQYAYAKALQLNIELSEFLNKGGSADDEIALKLSNDIFRYVLPADRLLRYVGREYLTEELPIKIKGTLREMAFYFYQEKRDYPKALDYIDKWLNINPNDDEILLYQARCFRNIRGKEDLVKAEKIISKLTTKYKMGFFAARIFREKAIIAEIRGDREKAKSFYREGIESSLRNPYPENYIGLAQLLIRELDDIPYWESIRENIAEEAVELLEKGREEYALFDRFHLGLYVEALIQAGQGDKAYPLLKEALEERPEDERLNHWMAEMLREVENYNEAEKYALKAKSLGYQKAALTLANIKYGQSLALKALQQNKMADQKLSEALEFLSDFRPILGSDTEIVDAIKSKIYRAQNNWELAKDTLEQYKDPNNYYIVYEQSLININEIDNAIVNKEYPLALLLVNNAIGHINKFAEKKKLKPSLKEILRQLMEKEEVIQRYTTSNMDS